MSCMKDSLREIKTHKELLQKEYFYRGPIHARRHREISDLYNAAQQQLNSMYMSQCL